MKITTEVMFIMRDFLFKLRVRLSSVCSWRNLNPLNWSKTTVKLFLVAFITIMLPVYFFIGFQPSIPADAASYPQLEIPAIGLKSPVAHLELTADHQLIAPAAIAGVYTQAQNKLFIIGHSSTVFKHLDDVQLADTFTYDDQTYRITDIQTLAKPDIDMRKILQAAKQETIVIMTCAGTPLPDQDATHRLIVTAIRE